MPLLKLLNEPYHHPGDLERVIDYILRSASLSGGVGVDVDDAVFQMQLVKKFWHKTAGRQVRHFILSFSNTSSESLPLEDIYDLSLQIAQHYCARYQIVFGIHTNSDHVHVHFALNTVSYIDGKMYREGYGDCYTLKALIENLTGLAVCLG